MVELLAVITILGILSVLAITSISGIVQKSRDEEKDKQEKIVVLAVQSYLQFNRGRYPKDVGNEVSITLNDLRTSNFLKEDVKSPQGKNCMAGSYVTVKKVSQKKYTYTAHLNC